MSVRDKNLEGCLLLHEIALPQYLAFASEEFRRERESPLPFLGPVLPVTVCAGKEIGGQPAVTCSCHDQPPLQAMTAIFQVGQGHKGDDGYRVKGTES